MASKDMRGGNYAAELQPREVYSDRRRKLLERVGEGMVVLWGAGDDRGYGDVGTFRQSSTFFYLTGVELPNAVLVLRQGEGGDLLFLPPRNPNVERWTGPKFGPGEETAAELGFGDVLSTDPSEIVLDARRRPVPGFESRLHGWLSEAGAVLWTELPPVSSGAVLPPTHRLLAKLRDRLPTFAVKDVDEHMTALRSIKDAGEIDLMRQAIAITIEGQRRAAKALKPQIRVIGVEPQGAPTLKRSLAAGRLVTLERIETAANTLAPRRSEEINLEIISRHVDDIVLVDDAAMRAAARWLWFEFGVAAELSGAAAIAALQCGLVKAPPEACVAALVCGAGSDGFS